MNSQILAVKHAQTVIDNVATAITLISADLLAHSVQIGDMIMIRLFGTLNTKSSAAGNLTFTVNLGSTALITHTLTPGNGLSGTDVELDALLIVDAKGASGKVFGVLKTESGTAAVDKATQVAVASAVSVDLSATGTLSVKAQFATADAANELYVEGGCIEVIS